MKRLRKGLSRGAALTIVAGLVVMLVAVLVGILLMPLGIFLHMPEVNQWYLWGARAGAVVLIWLAVRRYTITRHSRPHVATHHKTRDIGHLSVKLPESIQERGSAEQGVGLRRAAFFAEAVTAPKLTTRRIVEEYEPGFRSLKKKVTLEVQVGDKYLRRGDKNESPLDNIALIPILLSPKSVVQDNLHITDADGHTLSSLSYREYLELTARVLRVLIAHGSGSSTVLATWERAAVAEIARRRNDKLRLFSIYSNNGSGRPPTPDEAMTYAFNSKDPEELKGRIDDIIKAIEGARDSADEEHASSLSLAANLIKTLVGKYAVVVPVPVPANGRVVLHYVQNVSPKRPGTGRPRQRTESEAGRRPLQIGRHLKSAIAVMLGARPVTVDVRLDLAGMCQSYHLRIIASEGYYLGHQALDEKRFTRYFSGLAADGPAPPHVRYGTRLGQRYAHLYVRNGWMPEKETEIPVVSFAFYEVPPSSDFRAGIAALAAAFLIGLIGFSLSHVSGSSESDPVSDAPLLLLAFPGVAASWLGLDATSVRLFDSSLAARCSLVVTIVSSMIASGLFIINKSGVEKSVFNGVLPDHMSLLGISRDWWVGVTAAAVMNAICITYVSSVRAWKFAELTRTARLSEI